ncbi:hypothetical protein GAY28_04185, partial [Azospirillum brasilense]|nr:hypothetical protein [Azospirillum brasilense]
MTPGGPEAGFAADARPTCGSCGVVYDPTAGGPGRGGPPGQPFRGLPALLGSPVLVGPGGRAHTAGSPPA